MVAALSPAQFTLDNSHPTGGVAAVSSNAGSPNPPPNYYLDSNGWWDGTSNGVAADSCSQAVTYSWTWQGPPGTAPANVVLKVESRAQWSNPAGDCDDGLPSPADPKTNSMAGPTLIGQSQTGVRYVLRTVSGGTVTYSITPTAHATYGTCSVGTRVTLAPVTIESNFGLRDGQTFDFLVGQQADFYVSAPVYTIVPQSSWSIDGSYIRGVDLSGGGSDPYGDYYDRRDTDQGYDGEADHLSVYFDGGEDPGAHVDRSVALYDGNTFAVNVSISRKVHVYGPTVSTMTIQTAGPATILDSDPTTTGDGETAIARNSANPNNTGFIVNGQMSLPTLFTNFEGEGTWNYVQLCGREYEYDNAPQPSAILGLDNSCPYAAVYKHSTTNLVHGWYPTSDGTVLDFYDAPSIGITGHSEYADYFHGDCFSVLRPPHQSGQGTVDLPMAHVTWDYQSSSTRTAPETRWANVNSYYQTSVGWIATPSNGAVTPSNVQKPVLSYEMDWTQANMNG